MKDTPVLLHIKFRSLVEEGLIKHFRFGETPAPEDLLFALFSQWRRSDIHLIDTCSCITNAQYDIIKLLHARVVGLKSSAHYKVR